MRVFVIGLTHPLFAYLFTYSSFKAYKKAKELFPKSNSNNGIGNAFRHAYWSCLIMMYFCKISSPQKALKWCKIFTDMHEDLFPNDALARKMDLHNNRIGMTYFVSLLPGVHRQFFESSFFINGLLEMTKDAVFIDSLEAVVEDKLIYLE